MIVLGPCEVNHENLLPPRIFAMLQPVCIIFKESYRSTKVVQNFLPHRRVCTTTPEEDPRPFVATMNVSSVSDKIGTCRRICAVVGWFVWRLCFFSLHRRMWNTHDNRGNVHILLLTHLVGWLASPSVIS